MLSGYEGRLDPEERERRGFDSTTSPPLDYNPAQLPGLNDNVSVTPHYEEALRLEDEHTLEDIGWIRQPQLELFPTPPTTLDSHGDQVEAVRRHLPLFQQRLQALASLREEVLPLRSRVEFEWTNCKRYLEFVDQSQTLFLEEVEASTAALDGENSLHTLRARVLEDHSRQKGYAQSVADLEAQLEPMESTMQKLERKVLESARLLSDLLAQNNLPQDSAPTVTATVASSVSSAKRSVDVHPLMQHYLEKSGDWKIERDKLFDLDQEHREQKANRQFFQDQGLEPETPDKEFDKHWLDVFTEAEIAFVSAKHKYELALDVCESEGLDPEAYRKAAFQTAQEYDESPQLGSTSIAPATPPPLPLEIADGPRQFSMQPLVLPSNEHAPTAQYTNYDPPSPSSQRRPQLSSPRLTRVEDWVQEQSDTKSRPPSDLQSQSNFSSMLIFDPSRRDSSRSESSRVKKYHRSIASYLAGWVEDEDGQPRPALIQRSSSESQIVIIKDFPDTHDRFFPGFRRTSSPLRQQPQQSGILMSAQFEDRDKTMHETAANVAQTM